MPATIDVGSLVSWFARQMPKKQHTHTHTHTHTEWYSWIEPRNVRTCRRCPFASRRVLTTKQPLHNLRYTARMYEKHIWICAFMAVGSARKCTMGEVDAEYADEVSNLASRTQSCFPQDFFSGLSTVLSCVVVLWWCRVVLSDWVQKLPFLSN